MDKKVSIERIADALENIESFSKELPDVTAADAGKVLMVNENGEWVVGYPQVSPEQDNLSLNA